jgi:putative tryptophan/tyrosine transport system substrate-binding protein
MAIHIERRELIVALGSAAATAWPIVVRPQSALPTIGFLSSGSPRTFAKFLKAFQQGLLEQGFVEGKNLAIEYRWAEDQYDQLPSLAADLIQRRATVIAASPRAVDAAKALTATIPIVFLSGSDPVRIGLVASLNRPGGNLTGVSMLVQDITKKRFGLLHDLAPQASVGVLWDSTSTRADPEFALREVQAIARSLNVPIRVMGAATESEIDAAFATFAREGVSALFVVNGFFLFSMRDQLAVLARFHKMALSGEARDFVESGGLMSYGANVSDGYRQVGYYTGRVLKGEKPADLPVVQPTRFEFVINLKTANALGLTIPETLLATADKVIQ